MEIVLAVLGILVIAVITAAVMATRPRDGRRRSGGVPGEPPPPAPTRPGRLARRSKAPSGAPAPSEDDLEKQAAEVVAEAEALLAGPEAPAAPEETGAPEAPTGRSEPKEPRDGEAAAPGAPGGPQAAAEPEAAGTAEPGEPAETAEGPDEADRRPRLRDRLGKARSLLGGYWGSVRSRERIDEATWDDLEEALVRADVGVTTTTVMLDELRLRVKADGITTPDELLDALKTNLKKGLTVADRTLRYEPGLPNVWLFVGVNGVGKTTTIGKVGRQQVDIGRSVIMAAGDTFRAAAAEQLELWSQRVGATLVRGKEGGDPGAVIFDAVERAKARGVDLVLADTAGRLHTKTNLMEELRKVRRVAEKAPGVVTEVLLVIDATTGQNGMVQAKQFTEAVDVTGVVLTKLDGTAKGGIALAIQTDLGIPIKLVGLGETAADLVAFDPDEFIDALFDPA